MWVQEAEVLTIKLFQPHDIKDAVRSAAQTTPGQLEKHVILAADDVFKTLNFINWNFSCVLDLFFNFMGRFI